jgi:type IV secretion system protein VirB5
MDSRSITLGLYLLVCLLAGRAAHAQFAVIDVGAITQLIAQAQTLQQQLLIAQNELAQAQAQFNSMTGGRGMERLLAGVRRNYLPANWTELEGVLRVPGGQYGALSAGVASSIQANAVLSPLQLAAFAPQARVQVGAARDEAALAQNVSRQALQSSSERFQSLQQLINALPGAADQKAALDLQARIAAENAMLQNEQIKLQSLDHALSAEARADAEQAWERGIAGHGQFASRFQPTP